MGFFSDMFSPGSVMSGGLTFTNDNLMKAMGTQKGDTLFAVNDALKHGPIETSIEKGRPANFSELEGDRANRLGADKSGTARGIGDIAALIGMIYGGAALSGGSGGSAAAGGSASGGAAGGSAAPAGSMFMSPASSNSAFNAANTGTGGSMWPQLIKTGMQMGGGKGGQGGGMMGGLFGMGQQQPQKPQFDTNAWIQKQKDDQNKMLLAQNLQASKPPEYNDYG